METMRVLLVDDHAIFRKGLARLMLPKEDIEVVGEAGDGREAFEQTQRLRPDVVLMDIQMPGCDGIKATRLIKQEMPEVKVVMLTISDEDQDLFDAIKGGAQGYLLKNTDPDELFEMLRGMSRGEAPISRMMAARILEEFARMGESDAVASDQQESLSRRELEVLQLVAQGATNKEVGRQLFITENTVKNHMRSILAKLHLQNRAQAAAYAQREGLIHTPPREDGEPKGADPEAAITSYSQ